MHAIQYMYITILQLFSQSSYMNFISQNHLVVLGQNASKCLAYMKFLKSG